MSKSFLLVPGLCLVLFAACKTDTECSTEEQRLRDELARRDMRISNLEDSLRMARNGSAAMTAVNAVPQSGEGTNAKMPANGKAISSRALYREGRSHTARNTGGGANGMFPEGSERALTDDDLQYLTPWGTTIIEDEIYARHGARFNDPDVQEHFNNQSWYRGRNGTNVSGSLTKLERTNVAFIQNYKAAKQAP